MQQHSSSICIFSIYISQLMLYSRAFQHDLLDIGLLVTRKLLKQISIVKLEPSLRKIYGRINNLVMTWLMSICVTNDHGCVSFVVITIRVSHVEQELLTIWEHLRLSAVFSGVRVAKSLVFCVIFCRSLFILLFFFFWPLCCLSFLQFTTSDYHCCIFKLFLYQYLLLSLVHALYQKKQKRN